MRLLLQMLSLSDRYERKTQLLPGAIAASPLALTIATTGAFLMPWYGTAGATVGVELVLTFEEIEDILGFALPRASQRASWWEKERNPENARPQRDAIRDGGYEATRLADGKGVRFRRLSAGRYRPGH